MLGLEQLEVAGPIAGVVWDHPVDAKYLPIVVVSRPAVVPVASVGEDVAKERLFASNTETTLVVLCDVPSQAKLCLRHWWWRRWPCERVVPPPP